ncbi:hypothetical protein TRVL_07779 [Trypanosoma vivax]|nr:hypothetical protein TRVL_07779 [Trypanosoma vivax]
MPEMLTKAHYFIVVSTLLSVALCRVEFPSRTSPQETAANHTNINIAKCRFSRLLCLFNDTFSHFEQHAMELQLRASVEAAEYKRVKEIANHRGAVESVRRFLRHTNHAELVLDINKKSQRALNVAANAILYVLKVIQLPSSFVVKNTQNFHISQKKV